MKIGAEDKKKLTIAVVLGVLGLGAAIYIYSQLSTPDVVAAPVAVKAPVVRATPAPAVNASSAKTGGASSAAKHEEPVSMDPTLKMGSMLLTEALVYTGSGRNIFSATSVPVVIPKPIASARPAPPPVPVYTPPPGPPPPPPIDLKFFGTATAKNGTRQAFLLHGEDVFLASSGDIVQRRYKIVSIAANSMVVEDLTNNNRQTLPLLAN